MLGRRKQPIELLCYDITKGVTHLCMPFLLGRNPHVWGEDVAEFDPERFAGKGRAGNASHPFAWLPFGYGARGCIGMKLAMMEAKMILAKVVQSFEFELAAGQSADPDPKLQITMANQGGVKLRLQRVAA